MSHDQYFLSQVATEFWSVAEGKLTVYRDLVSAKAATYGRSVRGFGGCLAAEDEGSRGVRSPLGAQWLARVYRARAKEGANGLGSGLRQPRGSFLPWR